MSGTEQNVNREIDLGHAGRGAALAATTKMLTQTGIGHSPFDHGYQANAKLDVDALQFE
jgi:hypothetical protein